MIIGPAFIIAGYLNRSGILPTSPHSKGDPALIFPLVGIIFLLLGIVLLFISIYKEKKREKLQLTGIKLQAIVRKIKRNNRVRFGNKSPYIVYFTYEYKGDKYKGKSDHIWHKPNISVNDKITIYIDEYKNHRYFIKV